MVLEQDRDLFEDRVYQQYFIKSITKTDLGFKVDCLDKATFCRKDVSGDYERQDVDAMWFGWQLCRKEQ